MGVADFSKNIAGASIIFGHDFLHLLNGVFRDGRQQLISRITRRCLDDGGFAFPIFAAIFAGRNRRRPNPASLIIGHAADIAFAAALLFAILALMFANAAAFLTGIGACCDFGPFQTAVRLLSTDMKTIAAAFFFVGFITFIVARAFSFIAAIRTGRDFIPFQTSVSIEVRTPVISVFRAFIEQIFRAFILAGLIIRRGTNTVIACLIFGT